MNEKSPQIAATVERDSEVTGEVYEEEVEYAVSALILRHCCCTVNTVGIQCSRVLLYSLLSCDL